MLHARQHRRTGLAATFLLACLLSGLGGQVARGGPTIYVSVGADVLRFDAETGAPQGTFATGIIGAQGLKFGASGDLFVSNFNSSGGRGNRVTRYDGTTGSSLGSFASGGGLNGPVGLTFGTGGDLFVSSLNSGEVIRYNGTTGAAVGVFASGGSLVGPRGLTFGPGGDLFVPSGGNINGQVKRYDGVTGAFKGNFLLSNIIDPFDLTFGPSGDLFVTTRNEVRRYNGTTGAYLGVFASANQTAVLNGLIFGPNGDLYVTNTVQNGGILRFDGTTGALRSVLVSGLERPTYLTFRPVLVPEPHTVLSLAPALALCIASACAARRQRPTAEQS